MIVYDQFSVSYGLGHFFGSAWLKFLKEQKQVDRPPGLALIVSNMNNEHVFWYVDVKNLTVRVPYTNYEK